MQDINPLVTLLPIVIIILVLIGLFFLLIWYWKIDVHVRNQEKLYSLISKQNELLKKIYLQIGGNFGDLNQNQQIVENTPNMNFQTIKLSNVEKVKFEELMKDIKNDEVIVRIKYNGNIQKWNKTDWYNVITTGDHDKFELLYIFEN